MVVKMIKHFLSNVTSKNWKIILKYLVRIVATTESIRYGRKKKKVCRSKHRFLFKKHKNYLKILHKLFNIKYFILLL